MQHLEITTSRFAIFYVVVVLFCCKAVNSMNDIEKFEDLKNRIDTLKVKKLAAENEKKRLADELDKIKDEIKQAYGVGIEDFASAIETLKEEQEKQLQKLEELVDNAEKQVGV